MQARAPALMLFGCMALLAPCGQSSAADERIYLNKVDIERILVGKGLESRNLSTGMVSHWEFRPNGSVQFANKSGPGSASGTWVVRTDGLMCVTMLSRTGCRYWFRQGSAFANAISKEPDAPLVAEVEFE